MDFDSAPRLPLLPRPPRLETFARGALPGAFLGALVALALAAPLFAQGPAILSGPEKSQLLAIAREPLAAAREDRAPRTPQVGARLQAAQPIAVSLYLDGKLIARSWALERPGPLAAEAMALGAGVLASPDWGAPPSLEDLPKVKAGVSVFYRFREIKSDSEVGGGEGVVVLNGFKKGCAVPADAPPGAKAADILSLASVYAGMRPGGWLAPDSVLFASRADDEREK